MEERRKEVESKIKKLREEWKKAGPEKRKIIERQGRALSRALELMQKKDTYEIARELFKT